MGNAELLNETNDSVAQVPNIERKMNQYKMKNYIKDRVISKRKRETRSNTYI